MNDDCHDEIENEKLVYWRFGLCAVWLGLLNNFVHSSMRSRIDAQPQRIYLCMSRFLLATGLIKCVLGILLVSVLLPKCPADCTCRHIQVGYLIYGYVVLALGLAWLRLGYFYHKKADEATESASPYGEVAMS
jgi:hypothetical protein